MSFRNWVELALFLGILLLTARPLGIFIDDVMAGKRNFLSPILGPLEDSIYRIARIDPYEDLHWTRYTGQLLCFSAVSLVFTYAILRLQHYLPLNPAAQGPMNPHLAFNTAVSFLTNTNWQFYSGEGALSYFSQMVGLVFHNFVSAAVGIAAAVALVRGIERKEAKGIGNFWADLVRCNLYILLPLCIVFAIFLMSQGVIQNFHSYTEATTLEGAKQIIAQGPVASQVAIKMLGTNGGGFFNANAAHPFENPTPLSNFIQMLSIFLIPSALVYLLGYRLKDTRHGWSVWAAMALLFLGGVLTCAHFEQVGNPLFQKLGTSSAVNMEGKESRFGVFDSAFFATVTTDASCGAVNSMHDSFTPLGGLVPLVNIHLGEVIFGGVGAGLYGMMMYILLTVFIAGLMVGRTPEYFGQKIEGREIKYVMLAFIVMALSILGLTAWGVSDPQGLAGLANSGPHGLSEILYAYTSATGNNGSAFAGLSGNTPFWDLTMAFAMFFGRFFMMIPMLALAGSLAGKKTHMPGEVSFPLHGSLFVALLLAVAILLGALTFFPSLALGPIVEHFEMLRGHLF